MAKHLHDLGTLSILNGQTVSNALSGAGVVQATLGSLASMVIFTPATLPETVNVEVAPILSPSAGDWKRLQWQPGTDLVLAAAKAVNIPLTAGFRAFRLVAQGAVAAQRDFRVVGQVESDTAF